MLFESRFKMLSTFKILFKNYVFLESDCSLVMKDRPIAKQKNLMNRSTS